jgi:ubiquinone/menaquinone biosynthesis C-methylase UbiE
MFVRPEQIIMKFGIEPGMTVADFGVGSGFYSLEAGKLVGERGHVYALDIQKDLLERVKAKAVEEGLKNVEIIWANLDKEEGSKLADGAIDLVIISNLLFQMDNKVILAKESFRVLKNGGRVAVIDWSASFGGLGPRPEDIFKKEECQRIFMEAGFKLEDEFEAGENHYGLLFKK